MPPSIEAVPVMILPIISFSERGRVFHPAVLPLRACAPGPGPAQIGLAGGPDPGVPGGGGGAGRAPDIGDALAHTLICSRMLDSTTIFNLRR